MACSFAVRRLAFLSLLFSSLDHYSWADKDFLFEKGNLWSKKKTTKNHDDSRTGIGWMEQNTAAYMCDNADAWFYMEPFKILKAHRIYVEIEYKLKPNDSCLDSDCGLYLQSRKGTDATIVLKQTFSPDSPKIKAAQTRTVYSTYFDLKYNKEYLQLAIQAKGVCTTVFNISVYYYFCPRNVSSSGSLVLERTPAPKEGSVSVSANCREGSDFSGSPSAECFSNGTWKTFTTQQHLCRCSAGQEYKNGTGCTPCPDNYYKRDEHTRCEPCPENSRSRSGSSRCACNKTYYWHGKTGSCRKIPSNPRNLTYTVLEHNQIKLQWVKPVDSAKHEDLRYMVVCKPCGDLSIGDEGNNLNETHLIIQNIRNDTKYIFTVFALNGFSNQGSQKDWCQAVIDVQINGSSPGTAVVSALPSTTKESETPVPTESTSSDPVGSVEANSQEKSSSSSHNTYYIGAAIGGVCLIVVTLAVIFWYKRRMKKGNLEEEIPLREDERSYVDPMKYGNPEKAVRVFAKEIDRRQVKLEGVIGEGEFAKVHRGSLCRPNEPPIAVAVKVLKPGSSAKNREDFLTEAAVMGQFKDMNIVSLEGVVTISHPVMIITEFMHNGALSKFLAENRNRLEEARLLTMARGVASGMKYLARMRFVHRDLAARNVLVNENLVCKVADFGLTRELEESCQGEYVTQGGKIPIRWTAPEAYKHRRFTTASDVWSYGILLWEIMSFAERPYGNWDNYMVMDQVNANYRLTAPTNCPKIVHQLMMECWKTDRTQRPAFSDIVEMLERWIRNPYLLKDYEYVTEKVRMADRKSCVAKSIREYLETIKMDRYIDNFIDFGYTELYQIQHLNDSDLVRKDTRRHVHEIYTVGRTRLTSAR